MRWVQGFKGMNTYENSSHFFSLVFLSIFLNPPFLLLFSSFIAHLLLQLSCPLAIFWGDIIPISTFPCHFLS